MPAAAPAAAPAATAGASGVLQEALYGTGKLPKGTLRGSVSLPTILPAVAANGGTLRGSSSMPKQGFCPKESERPPPGVSMEALMKFLFPGRLENPDSCGRLEIFGKYGPTDEDGFLRGGQNGGHVHMDIEVNQMILHNCREALYTLFLPKDRSTVESTVDTLMPTAMSHRYTELEVKELLKNIPRYKDTGRMKFDELQELVKKIQARRLGEMAKRASSGKPIAPPKERPLKVPFQSKTVYALHTITRKKKHTVMEEQISTGKRLHAYSTLCASLEDQGLSEQVKMNSRMCRDLGPLNDKWDRYCALRRSGRSGYVQTRNSDRWNPSMDCGLGNKHPVISSLLAASCGGTSAGALLGAS